MRGNWTQYDSYLQPASLAAERVYAHCQKAIEDADRSAAHQSETAGHFDATQPRDAIDARRVAAVAAAVDAAAIGLGKLTRDPHMLMRLAFPAEEIHELAPYSEVDLRREMAALIATGSGRLDAALRVNYEKNKPDIIDELNPVRNRLARRAMEAAFARAGALHLQDTAGGDFIGRAVDGVRQAATEQLDRTTILFVAIRAWAVRGLI